MEDKILVFDIWSTFAHFRRGYTTTSSLTNPFPPKSSLIGMVAAILGIPNEQRDKEKNYYKIFTPKNFKIGLRILNEINTIVIKENLIDTKTSFMLKQRTQIPIQFLKNPKFRIYLWFNKDIEEKRKILAEFLESHETIYTPYLGISECIANFNYIGVFNYSRIKPIGESLYEIDSIVPKDAGKVIVEKEKIYGTIKIPVFINENRVGKSYKEFIYLENGNPIEKRRPIKIKLLDSDTYIFAKINEENVILF